jgi:hypothetical protein
VQSFRLLVIGTILFVLCGSSSCGGGTKGANGGINAAQATGADIGEKVNAAISSCNGAVCAIYIPAGNYTFSMQIAPVSGVELWGAGVGKTVLTYTGPAKTAALSGWLQNNIFLHDFTLQGSTETPSNPSSYNSNTGIYLNGDKNNVQRVAVQHFWWAGIPCIGINGSNSAVSDSRAEYCTYGIAVTGTNMTVQNNYASNHYSQAQAYEAPAVHYWDGLDVQSATDVLVEGNTSEDNGQGGIYTGGNGSWTSGVRIIGNTFQHNWLTGIDQGVVGDVVAGSNGIENMTIANNTSIDNLQSNIWVVCVHNATISGNVSSYTSGYGTYFGARAVSGTSRAGITLSEACGPGAGKGLDVVSSNTVTGNTVTDTSSRSNITAVLNGSGNVITGNTINQYNVISIP